MSEDTTSRDFFETKYRRREDPWDFEKSAYEQNRYAAILSAVSGRRYKRGFEPGCSIGVLTASLSPLCDELEAMDISNTAVHRARERCKRMGHVKIRCGALPEDVPGGQFDLIVFSEIGYYFEEESLAELVATLVSRLSVGGMFVAAHWLGTSGDHLLSGEAVHEVVRRNAELSLDAERRFPMFRLDRWVRR
jgi:predicted TPR repeat methyltransferase